MNGTVPEKVRHQFAFAFDLTQQALNGGRCFRCTHCSVWTQNPEDDKYVVCPQRDRRIATRRSSIDRRQEYKGGR